MEGRNAIITAAGRRASNLINKENGMTNITLDYLGKPSTYILLTSKDVEQDRVVSLSNYHFLEQGYDLCYNEDKRFHFLIDKSEIGQLNKFLKGR